MRAYAGEIGTAEFRLTEKVHGNENRARYDMRYAIITLLDHIPLIYSTRSVTLTALLHSSLILKTEATKPPTGLNARSSSLLHRMSLSA